MKKLNKNLVRWKSLPNVDIIVILGLCSAIYICLYKYRNLQIIYEQYMYIN